MKTAFMQHDVASHFLDHNRRAIPFAEDQLHVMLRVVDHYVGDVRRVVDLGCGDGILARTVLGAHPGSTALLVDQSLPMLSRAAHAMRPYAHRFHIAQADISERLPAEINEATIDLVVSGFAIHHLPQDRKKWVYGAIYNALRPGGLFINLEHVASPSAHAEALWDKMFIENLAHASGRPESDIAREYHGRADKADNILEPVSAQMEWLRAIGYEHVDCYFKILEIAMFGGVKPQE